MISSTVRYVGSSPIKGFFFLYKFYTHTHSINEVSCILGLNAASHCRRTFISCKNNIEVGLN